MMLEWPLGGGTEESHGSGRRPRIPKMGKVHGAWPDTSGASSKSDERVVGGIGGDGDEPLEHISLYSCTA